jgi:hypothetical protein
MDLLNLNQQANSDSINKSESCHDYMHHCLHVIVTSRSSTAKDITALEGVQVSEIDEVQAVELFYRYS